MPFSSCLLPSLIPARQHRTGEHPSASRLREASEENDSAFSSDCPLGIALPWAPVMIAQTAASVPARDDRGRGSVCAKAVGGSISHGVGISGTARIPNASAWSVGGKRRGGKPNVVKTMRSKPGTPGHNVRAASVPHLRRKPRRSIRLQSRVVTQQIFFTDANLRPAWVP